MNDSHIELKFQRRPSLEFYTKWTERSLNKKNSISAKETSLSQDIRNNLEKDDVFIWSNIMKLELLGHRNVAYV